MMNMVRIESADNGFIVRYDDPEVEAKNRREDSFSDPERQVVYPDMESLKEGLDSILEIVNKGVQDEAMERAKDFSGGFKITAEAGG